MGLSDILAIKNNKMIKQLVPENLQNISDQLHANANQITSLASGSPKNVFATKELLDADAVVNTLDGKKSVYLVTADGKWYYWNGTAWVSGGVYQATGITDSSVLGRHIEKTSACKALFQDKNNLINPYITVIVNNSIDHTTGLLTESAINYVTDYIPVPSSSILTCKSFEGALIAARIVQFDVNKVYVSGQYNGTTLLTTSPTTKFVRFSLPNALSLNNFFVGTKDIILRTAMAKSMLPMIASADFPLDVEASKINENAKIPQIMKNKIVDNYTLTNTILSLQSVNIANINELQLKKTVDENGEIIDTTGSNGVLDVKLKPNTNYAISTGTWLVNASSWWLDMYGYPISKPIVLGTVSYTSPSNAYYLRCCINYANMSTTPLLKEISIVLGNTLPSTYQPFLNIYKIKDEYLSGAKGLKDWTGYKYYALGDSRTEGYSSNVVDAESPTGYLYPKAYEDIVDYGWNYPREIQYRTNITLYNVGVSGSAWAYRVGEPSIPIMIDHINGNGSLGLTAMPTDINIVTIHAGTNDRPVSANPGINEILWDNLSNIYDINTFKGSIRATLKALKVNYPLTTVILLVDTNDTPKNSAIEEVARQFKVKCLKLYECAGLPSGRGDTINLSEEMILAGKVPYYTDTLHESVEGHKVLGRVIAGEMAKYLW